jgi:hypothetical protein
LENIMIYASVDPATLDPTPWNVDESGGNTAYGSRADAEREHPGAVVEWMPLAPATTHPHNPILVAFRDALATDLYESRSIASLWADLIESEGRIEEPECSDATPEQIDHARRVLARLANFNA